MIDCNNCFCVTTIMVKFVTKNKNKKNTNRKERKTDKKKINYLLHHNILPKINGLKKKDFFFASTTKSQL